MVLYGLMKNRMDDRLKRKLATAKADEPRRQACVGQEKAQDNNLVRRHFGRTLMRLRRQALRRKTVCEQLESW